jgi:osmotically-inducible protein OsmY
VEAHDRRGRSDESIIADIWQSLARHPGVSGSGIDVQVEAGEVTLAGSVEHRDARWLIQDLAESVSGVSLVHNRLRVSGT